MVNIMFRKILIANRGEAALRIIRACWEMGIETVCIYSSEDKESMHTKIADRAVCIGAANASESYLQMDRIIDVAKFYNVDAIHPGYGFLAENHKFADMCLKNNIVFIGPLSETIELMGNKLLAKEQAKKIGIPIVPGGITLVSDKNEAKTIANKIGYPIMIKAVNGGGGKGIRKVLSHELFENNYELCVEEVRRAFEDDRVYIEKYINNPRHVEVQVLVDKHKNILVLGERDCSIQRKNQKLIEESPATILDEDSRRKLHEYAKRIVSECNYINAGTVEFLIDDDKNIYFMEMNTRLQVEHVVTELVTNIDIVKEQIRIANGEKLEIKQEDIQIRGHAMECRINAEQPKRNFSASVGTIKNLNLPGGNGIRIDTAIYSGMKITQKYDSNIAKLVSYGKDRDECINKLKRGLYEFVIDGIETNIEFLIDTLNIDEFLLNNHNTYTLNELINKNFSGCESK